MVVGIVFRRFAGFRVSGRQAAKALTTGDWQAVKEMSMDDAKRCLAFRPVSLWKSLECHEVMVDFPEKLEKFLIGREERTVSTT